MLISFLNWKWRGVEEREMRENQTLYSVELTQTYVSIYNSPKMIITSRYWYVYRKVQFVSV